jgi:hypothetical protein
MASILIKDLNESKEMDRAAMRAVVGGSATAHFTYPSSPYRSLLQTSNNNPLFDWVMPGAQSQTDF